jgi:hypothetical protein
MSLLLSFWNNKTSNISFTYSLYYGLSLLPFIDGASESEKEKDEAIVGTMV